MCEQKAKRCIKSKRIAVPLLAVPLGLLLGTHIGIIADFGVYHTVDTIRRNPETFADQYAKGMVWSGWASVVITVVLAITALCWYACRSEGGHHSTELGES